ncbi:MAG: hypothetical protein ACK2U0_20090 [Candidatus Promineifilaceae bacterium]|jgi:hypothetical protein
MANQALFEGLIFDEYEQPVETTHVGDQASYVVNDDGFLRHVDAETVDRQILSFFLEQLEDNKELAIEQALSMLGKDDLFTKAALDAQLRNIDMDQIIAAGISLQAREMLGMLGFQVIINIHGDVVKIQQPSAPESGE